MILFVFLNLLFLYICDQCDKEGYAERKDVLALTPNELEEFKYAINAVFKSGVYELYATCNSCLMSNISKIPFGKNTDRTSNILTLVHINVCGQMKVHARGDFSYFITLTDNFSRYR